jgi:hypothetical protein
MRLMRHFSRSVVALLLFISCAALAQSPPRVASLAWMTGTWNQSNEKENVSESWLGPANGLMVATNLTTRPNGLKSFEFLRISETPEGFSYFASPGGRPPVEFKMKEQGDQRVVFENPSHDFPRRIAYWRDGEALLARTEGMMGGKPASEEWRFQRVK